MTIQSATGGLAGDLGGLTKGVVKRDGKIVEERALSNQEVAQTLSNLLNGVAGAVNLVEGLTGKLPILGPILKPIFGKINGDLSVILSSVGTLLVGVVSLVKDLVCHLLYSYAFCTEV